MSHQVEAGRSGAERIDVGSAVDGLATNLLGRRVVDGPDHPTRQRMSDPVRRRFRQPEVGEVDVLRSVEQSVRRLDVSMDKAACVRSVEGVGELGDERERAPRLERPLALEKLLEVRAFDEAHGDVELPVNLAGGVDRDDVGMVERCSQLRFAQEPLAEAVVRRQLGRQQLQSDLPLQAEVVGPVDHAHPAAPQQRLDSIADELGPDSRIFRYRHGLLPIRRNDNCGLLSPIDEPSLIGQVERALRAH
jgi:hypothetical protein